MRKLLFYICLSISHLLSGQTLVQVSVEQPDVLTLKIDKTINSIPGDAVNPGESLEITGGTPDYSYTWLSASNTVSTESNPTVYPTISTSYVIKISDNHNCSITDSVWINIGPVELPETASSEISVFPNPANEFLMIETSSNCMIRILRNTGETVLSKAIEGNTKIEAPSIPGIYLIIIEDKERTITKKIIVH